MIVVSVKQSRLPNRVFVKFQNGIFLPFNIDDVVAQGLVKGLEITDEQFQKLLDLSLSYLLTGYALNQIALSAKNEAVLLRKLKAKLAFYLHKYSINKDLNSPDLIKRVITKIKSLGLLNENEYVSNYIKNHPKKSRREIEYFLRMQGVDIQSIDSSLFAEQSETEKIKKLISKKIRQVSDLSDIKTKNKLIGYLVRKGFPLSLVKVAIDECLSTQ